MAETFELEVATPERLLVRERVTEAQIPLANGYIGVLAGHAPLLGALGTGELAYVAEGRRRYMFVTGGWVEVLGDHVRVLADTAEHADEIDVRRAEEALRRASERLLRAAPGVDVARALNALRRAQARLEAARHR
ncbi:MAG: F0F1 ATP synthase subunit epsilon [Bryobacterales bacterium]|nr:F0F1 ATP synthase subunit epsilon [Bryobacteraceae bacterium]MDW8353060.1 F0F1 ATP synthase subunit epsilon [Bryobacterales bacterium]